MPIISGSFIGLDTRFSKKPAVACAIKAQTVEELKACDFYKVPSKPAAGSGSAK